jgi:pilus assembly protein Flp/PilA
VTSAYECAELGVARDGLAGPPFARAVNELTAPPWRRLPVHGVIAIAHMAQRLRFHESSRGRRTRRDRNSHTASRVKVIGAHGGSVMKLYIQLQSRLQSLLRGEEGQDLLEYALLVSLIALVAVAAITLAGKNVNTIFQSVATALAPAA